MASILLAFLHRYDEWNDTLLRIIIILLNYVLRVSRERVEIMYDVDNEAYW